MLAKTERQAKMNSINKLGPLQYQITAPGNWPKIVLNNFGQHTMSRRKCTNPDVSMTPLTLWNCMEELSEIVHKGRKHYLIVRIGRQIKDWYPDELTNDLGFYSDDVLINNGLQYNPTLIILSHLKVGIEEPD
jgi:hypothetical protein